MNIITAPLVKEHWHIYAVVCESGDTFAVKIGVSSNPKNRYRELRVAIPYKSVMLHALVGTKKSAYALERKLHRYFDERNARGEWFTFTLEEKDNFHAPFKWLYKEVTAKDLKWERLTEIDFERQLKPLLSTNFRTCVTLRRRPGALKKTCGVLKS